MTQAQCNARRDWLWALVHASRERLQSAATRMLAPHRFEGLREPETGLVMVRGRMGGTGDSFNLGEATVARCVQRLIDPQGLHFVGVGYRLGRDLELVRWIAQFDALLQHPAHQADLLRSFIDPLRDEIHATRAAHAREVEASRVQFQTLDPQVAS
ncbi:MAG: phosphonate C-P lyase system protein PhnG [Burkholderiaceae bacterium]|nr:phosphonate C-P lyase system protein PhnG [Aquabacterium sp.]NUP86704.1 phosphonate C-P lyase system protein PhnG [Burkholderiaceae bacterium]